MLKLGTAKITQRDGLFLVDWMNHGSFLRPVMPMAFWTETEARDWCRERSLRVI